MNNFDKQFRVALRNLPNESFYKNYVSARDAALSMLNFGFIGVAKPSAYWTEELAGCDYFLDLSPLMVRKLRELCYHLTGIRAIDYRNHRANNKKFFEGRLQKLRDIDRSNLLVAESKELGGFGYEIGGELYNADTLKFYETLIGMDSAGFLDDFKNTKERHVVLEVGAGWGGLAYQFKKLFPNSAYIIVDFPQVLVFSATYLKTVFPNAKVFISNGEANELRKINFKDYDFVFLPHFLWDKIYIPGIDLAINKSSFQEMTTEQVDGYVRRLKAWGCPHLYSFNVDKARHNVSALLISEVLSRHYRVLEIHPMRQNEHVQFNNFLRRFLYWIRFWSGRLLRTKEANFYKHFAGRLV